MEYAAYLGSTTTLQIWSKWIYTGGTHFALSAMYECDGVNYYDYTVYEEVYSLVDQVVPNWSFIFFNNTHNGIYVIEWMGVVVNWSSGLAVNLEFSEGKVIIGNEVLMTTTNLCPAGQGICSTSIARGYSGSVTGYVNWSCPNCGWVGTANTSTYLVPSGWTVSLSPKSGSVPFSYTATITVPSTAACDYYSVGFKATSPNGLYTTYRISVLAAGCGGAGCVAAGTPVLTSSGYLPVQRISQGDVLVEYNISTGELVYGTVLYNNATTVSSVLSINKGALVTTLTDQPIWIRNATFTGWLVDPQNLTLGDKILDPVSDRWVTVTSLTVVKEEVVVFDVDASGPNDFIANGFLLDRK